MVVEGRYERRNLKVNNSSTRSGITNNHGTKILRPQIANADNANNLMRQQATSYQQKNNILRDLIECVLNCTLTYAMKIRQLTLV
jgi:hypothetical protein